MVESALYLIWFAFFFLLYLVFVPAKVMGRALHGTEAGENALKSFVAACTVLILCVYLLGLLHIYHPVTLALSLVIVVLVYLKLVKHLNYREKAQAIVQWLAHVGTGSYKLSVIIRQRLEGWKQCRKEARAKGKGRPDVPTVLSYVVVLIALGGLIAIRWPLLFDNYAYLTSDIYIHNTWINHLEQGDIFTAGVYPFGLHNVLSGFHWLSGVPLNVVLRYWGGTCAILLAIMLWFFARRVFESPLVAALAVVIYCVTDLTGYYFGYRTAFGLPQESGMLFLFPCVFFLGRYLKDVTREDGIYFVLSASLTLAMHFYSAIFAALMCACCCVAFFRLLLRRTMLRRLLLCLGLIVAIGTVPLFLGLASGKPWENSMTWALSIINTAPATQQTSDSLEAQDNAEDDSADLEGVDLADPAQKAQAFFAHIVDRMNGYWGYVLLASMGIFAVFLICKLLFIAIQIKRKRKICGFTWGEKMLICIWLFLLALIVMYCSQILELPRIIQPRRIAMFLGYVSPLIMVSPLGLLFAFLPGKSKMIAGLCSLAASLALFVASFFFGLSPAVTYFYLEHSLAAQASLVIEREFPDSTWTIVSPVEELSLVGNEGYHYELWDFITSMERYQEGMEIEIPTEYVFFVLEKKPLKYNQYRLDGLDYEFEPLNVDDAEWVLSAEMLGIKESDYMGYYRTLEARRLLEAKLAAWLEEYSKAFPDQMEVFLEDDDVIIYKFTQDLLMPNNFAIDYGYNVVSDLEYVEQLRVRMVKHGLEQLREKMLDRGQDVSEVDAKLARLRAEVRLPSS